VGTRDGRKQSTRACLFFFFSFTPNPSPKKPKKLKFNTLFFIRSIDDGSPPEKGGKINK
jgi:hypothetical protein